VFDGDAHESPHAVETLLFEQACSDASDHTAGHVHGDLPISWHQQVDLADRAALVKGSGARSIGSAEAKKNRSRTLAVSE
jgi:hypothetical protein